MDTESFEFETLIIGLGFLAECRPKLFFEPNNEKMRGLGFNPQTLIESTRQKEFKCLSGMNDSTSAVNMFLKVPTKAGARIITK